MQLRIGEVAKSIDVSPSTLRYWEDRGLIAPVRSPSGHRLYSESQVAIARRITTLRKTMKMGLEKIAEAIQEQRASRGHGIEISSSSLQQIGVRLRAMRKRKGISLSEIAEKCGLSVSFISLLERGLTHIAVDKLRQLANAYGTTVGELLQPFGATQQRLLKPEERFYLETGGVRIENLAVGALLLMEPQLFTVAPGAGTGESYTHDGEEFLFVIRGHFSVCLDEKEHFELESGDSLYFPSSIPHRWTNSGEEPCEVIWVNCPPTF